MKRMIVEKTKTMKQPMLGQKILELRQDKNLTQEELVDMCNVSVRTIQRIEAGEVTPRLSTIKILLAALDSGIEEIKEPEAQPVNDNSEYENKFQVAMISGVVYFALAFLEIAIEVMREMGGLSTMESTFYIAMKVLIFASFFLFMNGFINLAKLFEVNLVKIGAYLMILAVFIFEFMDIVTFVFDWSEELETSLGLGQIILMGAADIVFGISLLSLRDSMGRITLAAGMFEIAMGCCLVTVILVVFGLLFLVPALILEIMVLYRAYEYISRESKAKLNKLST